MTYRYVVYDLQRNFNAAFDDADFTFNQILYWVQIVANRMRVQQQLITNSDLFTSTFSSVPIQTDSTGKKYIDLPTQIMDLPNNSGIVYITYNIETCKCEGPTFGQIWFQGINIGSVQHLYLDEYTKPKANSPYFYRVGHRVDGVGVNRIYLLGLECIDVLDLEIAIKSSLDPKSICNIDENIPIPDELIQELMMQVLQLGKYIMMMPKENTNDGEDGSEVPANPYLARNAQLPDASLAQAFAAAQANGTI
jgi:hypothetical protein